MDFRPGDVATPLGRLRLSVGALARMSERLDAPDPASLAARLRDMGPEDARHLLACLLRRPDAEERVARLSDVQVLAQMPDVSRCIVEALK